MRNNIIEQSLEHLKYLTDLFDAQRVKYWVDFGTLLGGYREKTIISNDYDIDLCVFESQSNIVKKILEKLLLEKKIIRVTDGKWDEHTIYQFGFGPRLIRIDIYVCSERGTKVALNLSEQYSFHKFYIDELEQVTLGSYTFNAPRHLPSFLSLRYGNDYMTPQKRCDALNLEWDQVRRNVGKAKDRYVAYTSGVFDLFHVGHLNLFRRIKECFDTLIVGIHSDAEVRSYKPEPTIPYHDRVEMIRACKYVDDVDENAELIVTDEVLDRVNADYVIAGRDPGAHIEKFYRVSPARLHLIDRTPLVSTRIIRGNIRENLR